MKENSGNFYNFWIIQVYYQLTIPSEEEPIGGIETMIKRKQIGISSL